MNTNGKVKIGGTLEYHQMLMVAILSAPNRPGIAGKVLSYLGKLNIPVDFITESANLEGLADITFCVQSQYRPIIVSNLEQLQACVNARQGKIIDDVAILSIYGPHFREKPAIAGRFCSALGEFGINILGISTSISSVSCVIEEDKIESAHRAISQVFALPD